MHVHWSTGAEVYNSARVAAMVLNTRGIVVSVPAEEDPGVRLTKLLDNAGWRRAGTDAVETVREKLQRYRRISD